MLQKVISTFFAALLVVLSLGFSATGTPQTSRHTMSGMDHSTSASSCAIACTPTALHKDEYDDEINPDDKDKDHEPFYLQDQSSAIAALKKEHEQRADVALGYDPPPGLPAYIALTVFRA